MSLYAGQRPKNAKLDGPERGLDAIIGLILLVAEAMIVATVLVTFYDYGIACDTAGCASIENLQIGFLIALIGGGIPVVITTFVYLGRIIGRRRSWGAPLVGIILFGIAAIIGWSVMNGGA